MISGVQRIEQRWSREGERGCILKGIESVRPQRLVAVANYARGGSLVTKEVVGRSKHAYVT
jgi:hypothetical protein